LFFKLTRIKEYIEEKNASSLPYSDFQSYPSMIEAGSPPDIWK